MHTMSLMVTDNENITPAQTPESYTQKPPHEQLELEEAGGKLFSFSPHLSVVFVEKGRDVGVLFLCLLQVSLVYLPKFVLY